MKSKLREKNLATVAVMNNFTSDSRVLKTAESLRRIGYTPTVIAVHDKGLPKNETINNITVLRLSLSLRKIGKIRALLILPYLEFLIKSAFHSRKSKAIHCNDLATLPLGAILKTLSLGKTNVVYDSHEHQTEVSGLESKPVEKVLRKALEKLLIKTANAVITVSPSIATEYADRYKVEKPHIVLNCPPLHPSTKKTKKLHKKLGLPPEHKIFLYQGNISKNRGIELLLEAFPKISSNNHLVFMGNGVLTDSVIRASSKSDNIHYIPAVPYSQLLSHTESADFGIVFFENNCLNHYYCLPNKLFEYIQSEIPVLVSNLYELRRFVEKYNVGITALDFNSDALADAAEALLCSDYNELADNVRSIKPEYCWEQQEKVLKDIYNFG